MSSVEDLKRQLGEDAELLAFELEGDYIVAKFKQFQRDKGIFRRVAEKFKGLGGEYMGGLGARSHFRVKRETPQVKDVTIDRFAAIEQHLDKIRRRLLDIEGELAKLKEASS